MSPAEVAYRISQKRLIAKERKAFAEKRPVFEIDRYGAIPQANLGRLGLNFSNEEYSIGMKIELLGGYRYEDYRERWHAAFQSEGDWPIRYAADYNFGADDVPGDIRTNWELNRHYQFALLAKSFFATSERAYLDELEMLFNSWNDANPFMWGPEWSSPMESAIRVVNWLTAAAFLDASGASGAKGICQKLCDGAYVMAANIRRHYSRFSSANNHTIVEAVGVAISACVFGRDDWRKEALDLLEREIELQTWPDGVNKEQALHYQLFVMEALCLVSHALKFSGAELPPSVVKRLRSMARYAAACRVGASTCIEFGDDDEGIIFNPCVKKPFYLGYVLALSSLEVAAEECWEHNFDTCEQLRWLYVEAEFSRAAAIPLFEPKHVESFDQGGVTVARFAAGNAVVAFDHGPLGFGPLAAHGHADALSIQLFFGGEAVLVDPGTFVYNGNREARNSFRSTMMHSTLSINERDQSEILGPFLWGKKAVVRDFKLEEEDGRVSVQAVVVDYSSNKASRRINASDRNLVIADDSGDLAARATFLTSLPANKKSQRLASLSMSCGNRILIETDCELEVNEGRFSPSYGIVEPCWLISVDFRGEHRTSICLEAECR